MTIVGTGSVPFVASLWTNDAAEMRLIAARRLDTHWLERWWCKKYQRPSKDPLLQEYTKEELFIEFMEDFIEVDPYQEFPEVQQKDNSFVKRTGDAVADAWAEEIAAGKKPDFLAAFDEEDRERIKKFMKKAKKPVELDESPDASAPDEWHIDFAKD